MRNPCCAVLNEYQIENREIHVVVYSGSLAAAVAARYYIATPRLVGYKGKT